MAAGAIVHIERAPFGPSYGGHHRVRHNGKTLVGESYQAAKRPVAEQKAAREAGKPGDAPEGSAPAG